MAAKLTLIGGVRVHAREEYIKAVADLLDKLANEYVTKYLVLSRDNGNLCVAAVLDSGFLSHLKLDCLSIIRVTDELDAKEAEAKLSCSMSQENHEKLTKEEAEILGLDGLENVIFA